MTQSDSEAEFVLVRARSLSEPAISAATSFVNLADDTYTLPSATSLAASASTTSAGAAGAGSVVDGQLDAVHLSGSHIWKYLDKGDRDPAWQASTARLELRTCQQYGFTVAPGQIKLRKRCSSVDTYD